MQTPEAAPVYRTAIPTSEMNHALEWAASSSTAAAATLQPAYQARSIVRQVISPVISSPAVVHHTVPLAPSTVVGSLSGVRCVEGEQYSRLRTAVPSSDPVQYLAASTTVSLTLGSPQVVRPAIAAPVQLLHRTSPRIHHSAHRPVPCCDPIRYVNSPPAAPVAQLASHHPPVARGCCDAVVDPTARAAVASPIRIIRSTSPIRIASPLRSTSPIHSSTRVSCCDPLTVTAGLPVRHVHDALPTDSRSRLQEEAVSLDPTAVTRTSSSPVCPPPPFSGQLTCRAYDVKCQVNVECPMREVFLLHAVQGTLLGS
eukprot:GGOE01005082.1.p1 GENE.GGOE01005082.1~~GGOE01005082.1.p1  ORF type:complete len:313 (+),score=39.64 GGOE01005082.1:399-1337(+)